MIKQKMNFKWFVLAGLLSISSACSQQPVSIQGLVIQTIHASNTCGITEATIKSIDSQADLNHLMQTMPKSFGLGEMFEPDINYEHQMLILYAIGQKPSAGYSIEQYGSDASLIDQKLHLPVRVQSPAEGSVQAQMITSPCAIYLLPRVHYSEIIIENNQTD